jgi:hypothetical protein
MIIRQGLPRCPVELHPSKSDVEELVSLLYLFLLSFILIVEIHVELSLLLTNQFGALEGPKACRSTMKASELSPAVYPRRLTCSSAS